MKSSEVKGLSEDEIVGGASKTVVGAYAHSVGIALIHGHSVVKAVLPMPDGNATVVLRPKVVGGGAFLLESDGKAFSNTGFYRVQKHKGGPMRIWRVGSLREYFRVFV